MANTSNWRKSTYSNPSGNCVEVGTQEKDIVVRHSKRPDAEIIRFTRSEWNAFLLGVKDDEFGLDRLIG